MACACELLALWPSHYYLKKSHITHRYTHKNRTFFSRYAHFDEPLTPLLCQQHQEALFEIAFLLCEPNAPQWLYYTLNSNQYSFLPKALQAITASVANLELFSFEDHRNKISHCYIKVKNSTIDELWPLATSLDKQLISILKQPFKRLPKSTLPIALNIAPLPKFFHQ